MEQGRYVELPFSRYQLTIVSILDYGCGGIDNTHHDKGIRSLRFKRTPCEFADRVVFPHLMCCHYLSDLGRNVLNKPHKAVVLVPHRANFYWFNSKIYCPWNANVEHQRVAHWALRFISLWGLQAKKFTHLNHSCDISSYVTWVIQMSRNLLGSYVSSWRHHLIHWPAPSVTNTQGRRQRGPSWFRRLTLIDLISHVIVGWQNVDFIHFRHFLEDVS